MEKKNNKISFAFFGTSHFSVILLEELKNKFGIVPSAIITTPDMPVGRKQILTAPPIKIWAEKNLNPDTKIYQPKTLKDFKMDDELTKLPIFIVASYGKIIPKNILDIPSEGCLNVHPSLLPLYRGASPIQNQIINFDKLESMGTSIILMDEEMDHGPIVSQKIIDKTPYANLEYKSAEENLAKESADLLANVLPNWIDKKMTPKEQEHSEATFTKIIKKSDAEINLEDDPRKNYLKFLAYSTWPRTFFFFEKDNRKQRAVITHAVWNPESEHSFEIKKLIPEGRDEIPYKEFQKWIA